MKAKKKIAILKGSLKYKAANASLHIKYINNLNKQEPSGDIYRNKLNLK